MNEQTVWIVERGCYSDKYIVGIYATVEAAIAANPAPTHTRNMLRPGGWQDDKWGWDNGFDWDDAATCQEMGVQ